MRETDEECDYETDGDSDGCTFCNNDCKCVHVLSIAAGEAHACARMDDGSLWCWGDNTYGQLGFGTDTDTGTEDPVPVSLAGCTDTDDFPFDGEYEVVAGGLETCVLSNEDDGTACCWGTRFKTEENDSLVKGERKILERKYDNLVLGDVRDSDGDSGNVGIICGVDKMKENTYCWGRYGSFLADTDTGSDTDDWDCVDSDQLVVVAESDSKAHLHGEAVESLAVGDRHVCFSTKDSTICRGRRTSKQVALGKLCNSATERCAVVEVDGFSNPIKTFRSRNSVFSGSDLFFWGEGICEATGMDVSGELLALSEMCICWRDLNDSKVKCSVTVNEMPKECGDSDGASQLVASATALYTRDGVYVVKHKLNDNCECSSEEILVFQPETKE